MSVLIRRALPPSIYGNLSASATSVCAAAAGTGGILAKVLQHKELLVGFGKFAFNFSGILSLEQLTGGGTFGSNGSLDFAGLHGVVVVDLTELRADSVEHVSQSALSLAATIGDLSLKVTLPQLSLVSVGSDGIDDVAELTAQVDVQIGKPVAETIHVLADEIQTSFIPCGGSGIVYGKVSGKVGVTVVASSSAAAVITATAEAAAPSSAETAPAKEQKPRQECPHSSETTHSAIHTGGHFPGIRVTGADRVDVVDRYCFHFSFPFIFGSFRPRSGGFAYNISSPIKICKFSLK